MMKEAFFGPLLLLLSLAVTPRMSFANPMASYDGATAFANSLTTSVHGITGGAPNNLSSSIANDMEAGALRLTEIMIFLKNKMLKSEFEETVFKMEIEISKLPSELAYKRADILSSLYYAQDRIVFLRSILEQAATKLMGYCVELIQIYESNKDHEDQERLLKYSARNFLKYGNFVKGILEIALSESREIQDILSTTKGFLTDFRSKLNERSEEIRELKEAEVDIQKREKDLEQEERNIEYRFNEAKRGIAKKSCNVWLALVSLGITCIVSNNNNAEDFRKASEKRAEELARLY